MKRKDAFFQLVTAYMLLLLTTFLITPQDMVMHPLEQSPAKDAAVCCGECHQDTCCKLKRQVEVMNACCSRGLQSEIATSPKITVEEYVDGNIFLSIPPVNLTIKHANTFEIYSPDVLVPPPKEPQERQGEVISSNTLCNIKELT